MSDKLQWLKVDTNKQAGNNRYVAVARVLLPLLAILLLGISIIWSQAGPSIEVKKIDMSEVQNTLETARFTSVDKDGQPFVVEADKVTQQDPTTMEATLAAPRGSMKTKAGETMSLSAKDGLYDHNAQALKLNGDVVIKRDDGLTLETEALDVDLAGKNATGDKPVTAHTDKGDVLKAKSGIDVTEGGEKILFKGPASLTLQPKSQKLEE